MKFILNEFILKPNMYVYLILNRYGAFNNEKRNVESISMQYELFIITKLIWNTLCI